jgi:outer membrane protein OmpA-like peptidoglycan-associated protein
VKHVSEVVHQLRRVQVNGYGTSADESDSDRKDGFECHRKVSVSIGG